MVADDHTVVRRGMQLIVARRPGWKVIEAEDGNALFEALRRERVDVVIVDLMLRGRSGLDVLAQVRREHPGVPVLILSGRPEEQYAVQCIRAGARGYLQKDASAEDILEAIARVAAGRTWVSPAVAEHMAEVLARPGEKSPHERLSSRELEVFMLIAGGKTITEIAASMQLSVKTVSTYRARILEKTGFRSNADIVAYAVRAEMI